MAGKASKPEPSWDIQETHYHILGQGGQFLVLRHAHTWHPPTDVMADEQWLVVVVEVAGMKDGEFQVSLDSQHLIISGNRIAREDIHAAYHQIEVRYGEFRSEVRLPWPVDEDGIVAHYEDGLLRVELPRAAPHRVRVVGVDNAGQ